MFNHIRQGGTHRIGIVYLFVLPLSFIFMADSILSYMFPILVEQKVNSNFLLGVIMAASSVCGIVCDMTFPQLFKYKTWKFMLLSGIILAMAFPLALYLSVYVAAVFLFLLASLIWGIYYELLSFAQQSFIVSEEKSQNYSRDWGIVFAATTIATIIGPIISSQLLVYPQLVQTATIIATQIIALLFALLLIFVTPHHTNTIHNASGTHSTLNVLMELRYWKVIAIHILPAIMVGILIEFIEATYWTLGGLFGKEVASGTGMEWVVVILYSVPFIVGSIIMSKLLVTERKKFFSQLSILIGGLILSLVLFSGTNLTALYVIIFLSSFCFSFASPLNEAVYSDLLKRIGKDKMHLMGIAKANSSIAYIIAPLLMGFVADYVGYHKTFALLGVLCVAVAAFLLYTSPRKLHLPEKEIARLDEVM